MEFSAFHQPVTELNAAQLLISSINQVLDGTGAYFMAQPAGMSPGWYDIPADTLIVLTSLDFSSYHVDEIAFHGVVAHDLPEDIWDDAHQQQLSIAAGEERTDILNRLAVPNSTLPVFVFQEGDGSRYPVVAEGISWYRGIVYYQKRASLKEGERNAWFAQ